MGITGNECYIKIHLEVTVVQMVLAHTDSFHMGGFLH